MLYAPVSRSIKDKFQNEIEKLVPPKEIETYRAKEELSGRLRLPGKEITIAVLIVTDKKEFRGILSLFIGSKKERRSTNGGISRNNRSGGKGHGRP